MADGALTTIENLEAKLALFALEYDLRKQKDYQRLYDELVRLKAVRILRSLWALEHSTATAVTLRDHFRQFIDGDDGIVVMQVTSWATYNTMAAPSDIGSKVG